MIQPPKLCRTSTAQTASTNRAAVTRCTASASAPAAIPAAEPGRSVAVLASRAACASAYARSRRADQAPGSRRARGGSGSALWPQDSHQPVNRESKRPCQPHFGQV